MLNPYFLFTHIKSSDKIILHVQIVKKLRSFDMTHNDKCVFCPFSFHEDCKLMSGNYDKKFQVKQCKKAIVCMLKFQLQIAKIEVEIKGQGTGKTVNNNITIAPNLLSKEHI